MPNQQPTHAELQRLYDTPENRKAVACAMVDGIPCEYLYGNVWVEWKGRPTYNAYLNSEFLYRIKPTPELVPWEAQDVPPVCWLRLKADTGTGPCWIITGIYRGGICVQNTKLILYNELENNYIWSESPSPTSLQRPCGKEQGT